LFVVIASVVTRVNVTDCVVLAGGVELSVTLNVTGAFAVLVGVPLTIPVVPLRLSPVGSEPLVIDQEYAPAPPVALSCAEYATFRTKVGTDVEIDSAGTTVIESDCVTATAGASESCACTVNVEVPVAVGVPPIVAPVRVNPAGREPEPETIDQLYGLIPPVAVRPTEYAIPTCPVASGDVDEMASGPLIVSESALVACVTVSVAWNVTEEVVGVVGVPEMTPALLKMRPFGKVLPAASVHRVVPTPPAEARFAEYDVLMSPVGSVEVAMPRTPIDRFAVAV
jgi:hypothetical protein